MAKKYRKENDDKRLSLKTLKPYAEMDITFIPFVEDDIKVAKELAERNKIKWKDDKTWQGKLQRGRTYKSFLPFVIGRKLNSKHNKDVDAYVDEIEKSIDPLFVDIFSKYEYREIELDFIKSRLIAYNNAGMIDVSDPLITFSLRELLDDELMIMKLQKKARKTDRYNEIAKLQDAINKIRKHYTEIKAELGLMKPKLSKRDQAAEENKSKEDKEQRKASSMIAEALESSKKDREKIAKKIEEMRERKAKRGD